MNGKKGRMKNRGHGWLAPTIAHDRKAAPWRNKTSEPASLALHDRPRNRAERRAR